MLETLFRRCKQHQIVRKMQAVVPAAPNIDILIFLVMTFYPIHMKSEEVSCGTIFCNDGEMTGSGIFSVLFWNSA